MWYYFPSALPLTHAETELMVVNFTMWKLLHGSLETAAVCEMSTRSETA